MRGNALAVSTPFINLASADFNFKTGNNAQTNTDELVLAINAAAAGTKVLHLPPGQFKVYPFDINSSLSIIGAGNGAITAVPGNGAPANTVLELQSGTSNLVRINAHNVYLHRFKLLCSHSGSTAGAGLVIGDNPIVPGNGVRLGAGLVLRDFTVHNFYDSINIVSSYHWNFDNLHCTGMSRYGLIIDCADNPDAGDQCLTNSYFYTDARHADTYIKQVNGGGLKICNNKFNYHYNGGTHFRPRLCIDAALPDSVDLLIANNSFENYTQGAIIADGVEMMTITGNQFAPYQDTNATPMKHIHLKNANLASVTGNVFFGINGRDQRAVYAENIDDITTKPNTCRFINTPYEFINCTGINRDFIAS